MDRVNRFRVGGTFWAAQPPLPSHYVLVRSPKASAAASAMLASEHIVYWYDDVADDMVIHGDCDPWHMLNGATALLTDAADEVSVIAVSRGIPVHVVSEDDGATRTLDGPEILAELDQALRATAFENPFDGTAMTAHEAIALCGFWRGLIDGNRQLAGGLGFAFWKQDHVAPLLWSGQGAFPFLRTARDASPNAALAVWRSKVKPAEIAKLNRDSIPILEVEDGFLRSQGLGADCVPPLSITIDRLGAYFDPAQASELETLLEHGRFDRDLLDRAKRLRALVVSAGLGKYERAEGANLQRPAGSARHILVPGQVEDDQSVQRGGCGLVTNLDLLRRVRQRVPDAYIIYKPHPDVVAGHRAGAVPNQEGLELANKIISDVPIAALLQMVDEVHVNTSLTGFEALLRNKPVTTYGVPFYAGWGLTTDLGPVPPRRTARRTIDELSAAALLIYPRYLDPITGLPCPAEVVVDRLRGSPASNANWIVAVRRFQGRLKRGLQVLIR